MAKCIDCAWYPWVPGASPSMLPAMRCSPKLTARRWTAEGLAAEHECAEFVPSAEKEVQANDTDSGVTSKIAETVKRTNTSRRKR